MTSRLFASSVAAVSDALALAVRASNNTSVVQQIRTMMTFMCTSYRVVFKQLGNSGKLLGFLKSPVPLVSDRRRESDRLNGTQTLRPEVIDARRALVSLRQDGKQEETKLDRLLAAC